MNLQGLVPSFADDVGHVLRNLGACFHDASLALGDATLTMNEQRCFLSLNDGRRRSVCVHNRVRAKIAGGGGGGERARQQRDKSVGDGPTSFGLQRSFIGSGSDP